MNQSQASSKRDGFGLKRAKSIFQGKQSQSNLPSSNTLSAQPSTQHNLGNQSQNKHIINFEPKTEAGK